MSKLILSLGIVVIFSAAIARQAAPPKSASPAVESSPAALIEAGHWKQLRRVVESRMAASLKDAETAYLFSCVKAAFGDLDGALEQADRAVNLDQRNSVYHFQLGILNGQKANKASFLRAGSYSSRYQDEMKKAIELNPKYVQARWDLMEFYWHAPGIAGGDQKRARELADEIMHLNTAKGYLALIVFAPTDKKDAQVEGYYLKAIESAPADYGTNTVVSGYYLSDAQKKWGVADKYARQAIALDRGRSLAYSLAAVACAREDRWKDLDSVIAQAEKEVPDDFNPDFQAALDLLNTGKDPARAERYLRKYLTQEPEGFAPALSRAHWRLGQAVEKQGRKQEAVSEYQAALRLEPDLDGAKKDLSRAK